MKTVIEAQSISKTFVRGSEEVHAVRDVSLSVAEGEFLAVVGTSGSGKTTLVNILGCLDTPTSGTLSIGGERIFGEGLNPSERVLTRIRRRHFGYVFQKFFLIPTLCVAENIALQSVFDSSVDASPARVREVADLLGLSHRLTHLPRELSGGEMQRVAIARALMGHPKVLIADEPTGNLDSARTDEVRRLFLDLAHRAGVAIVMVTHDDDFAAAADRIIRLRDGRLWTADGT